MNNNVNNNIGNEQNNLQNYQPGISFMPYSF